MTVANLPETLKLSPAARHAIDSGRIARIELGCGRQKIVADAIGIDLLDDPSVDIVGDVFVALGMIPDESVDHIHASHFFEHVNDLPRLVRECARVLSVSGRLEVIVPHHSNPFFYSDYTHRQAFGLYSMSYLAEDGVLRRKVPTYGLNPTLSLVDVKLGFKSPIKYSMRNVVLRAFGYLVNTTRYTQELYEELLSRLVPCYEVTYVCERLNAGARGAG